MPQRQATPQLHNRALDLASHQADGKDLMKRTSTIIGVSAVAA